MASRICRKVSQKNLMINQDITLTNYCIIEGCLSLKIMTPKCYFLQFVSLFWNACISLTPITFYSKKILLRKSFIFECLEQRDQRFHFFLHITSPALVGSFVGSTLWVWAVRAEKLLGVGPVSPGMWEGRLWTQSLSLLLSSRERGERQHWRSLSPSHSKVRIPKLQE